MAIIKCPECGRQISDKAPACPNCGVPIAGKIVRCPQCGEIYFKDQEMCPNCHHLTPRGETLVKGEVGNTSLNNSNAPQSPNIANTGEMESAHTKQRMPQPPTPPRTGNNYQKAADRNSQRPVPPTPSGNHQKPEASKKSHSALIIGFILAVLACGICFYFYNSSKNSKEEEAYEFAMNSDDPTVLQTYLDTNPDAPEAHRDSIEARLENLKQTDIDWTNAVVSGSRTALEDYLTKHPNSEHKAEAIHKIDSLDWIDATNGNSEQSYTAYLSEHANGEHVDQANNALKALKAKTVQPEEKTMVKAIFRHFFQAINAKNEDGLTATVAPLMSNFLGKTDATKADVAVFMDKIYKDDISNMNWHINNDYNITKKEVGDEEYQYNTTFSAVQKVDKVDGTSVSTRFNIKATIGPDGLISSMSMTKILE